MANFAVQKETETWNVAQGYINLKILLHLVELDKLVKIAIYGTERIEDSVYMSEEFKKLFRLEAIKRLIDSLLLIIENTKFVMGKETEGTIIDLKDRIQNVKLLIDPIEKKKFDQRTGKSEIDINEEHFSLSLTELRDIKTELNLPLNKHSLIFPSSDEVDLEKYKEQLMYGG